MAKKPGRNRKLKRGGRNVENLRGLALKLNKKDIMGEYSQEKAVEMWKASSGCSIVVGESEWKDNQACDVTVSGRILCPLSSHWMSCRPLLEVYVKS